MKKLWSKSWKSSKQPRKQRKYIANAPLHIKKNFMSTHLSKDLQKKYSRRNIPIRKGDRVKILRGQFKKTIGKIDSVDLKKLRVYIEGVQNIKKDGTKTSYPIHPSNLLILELNLEDKKRRKILERKTKAKETKKEDKGAKKK